MLVAAVAVVARGADRFFFFFDDVLWQYEARRHPFGLRFFVQPINDHFVPAYLFTQRYAPAVTGYRYWCLALLMAVAVGLITVLLWHIGAVFDVPEPRRLVLVALFGLSAVFLEVTGWWAMAAHILPSAALILVAWLLYAQFLHGRTRWRGFGAALALFLACAFIEKSLVWVVLLPLFDLIVWQRGASWRGRLAAFATRWRFHAAIVAAGAGYVLWMYGALATQPRRPPPDLERYARFVWLSWYRGFWPMVTNLRGQQPRSDVVLVALQAVLLLAAGTWLAKRPRDRAVAAWFVLSFVVNQLALTAGRASFVNGATFGEYHADSLVGLAIAAIVVAAGTSAATPRVPWHRPSSRAPVAVAVAAALLIGGVQSSREFHRQSGFVGIAKRSRIAFSSVGRLPRDGVPLLDAPFPWDPSAFPFTTPGRWLPMARPASHRAVVDVGNGPFWAVTGSGRFARTDGAPRREPVDGCAAPAVAVSFPISEVVEEREDHLAAWEVWVDVDAVADSTIVLQLSGDGEDPSGRLRPDAWFDPSFEAGGVTKDVPVGGVRRIHIFANPRWHAALRAGRVVVTRGGPVCVHAAGYGYVP